MATTYSFNENIPAANNNPSADQPIMQTNNASTKSIIGVDHVTFGTATGGAGSSDGQHLQVTYNNKHSPAAQVDPISTAYTNNSATMAEVRGSTTTVAQNFYRNQNGIYPLSPIKAFAVFTCSQGATTNVDMGINIASLTSNGAGTVYTINIVPGAVQGTVVAVLVSGSVLTRAVSWTYALDTLTLTVATQTAANQDKISFAILQV